MMMIGRAINQSNANAMAKQNKDTPIHQLHLVFTIQHCAGYMTMLSTWRVIWTIIAWGYGARAILQDHVSPTTTIDFAGVRFSQPVSIALQRLGIHDKPSPIQAAAIPRICSGLSCMLHAPTGSGKTFAFALPALKRLTIPNQLDNNGRVIIVAPTEELALQVIAVIVFSYCE
jgi:superfamily II DNA helicase RecQ